MDAQRPTDSAVSSHLPYSRRGGGSQGRVPVSRGGGMTVAVSLLRGINVGGHNLIRMEALRGIHESLGLVDVETYVQSGNVVFRTRTSSPAALASRIEDAVERSHGFRPGVLVRTAAELQGAIAGNPFDGRAGIEPAKLLVMFLAARPEPAAGEKFLEIKVGPEEFHLRDRELYIYFPEGQGRSKLTTALIDKTLRTYGTGRNWNTVTRLREMAASLER